MTEPKIHRRRCGDCRLCCTVMAVKDLEPPKAAQVTCQHVCSRGCRIYPDRPDTCRDFECLWKLGALPKEDRPDLVGYVGSVVPGGQVLCFFTDAARPDAWEAKAGWFEALARKGVDILVGNGGERPHTRFTRNGRMARDELITPGEKP